MAYLPSIPAYAAVPQAMTTTRSMSASTSSSGSSSGSTTAPSCTRPMRVLATASGSSLISFFMKLGQPPFSAAEASQAISKALGVTGVPAKSMTRTESGRIVTIWSWPISRALRVCSTKAATSEPKKFSPSPRPTTSGELRRAPTTTPGSSWCITSRVNAPSRRVTTRRIASVRSPVSR